jgi:transposase, IS6 family
MNEKGLTIVHTTIMRWFHTYSPEINKRKAAWRVDETYIKINGKWF